MAESVSTDTYVNIMGQYRPAYQVGEIASEACRDVPVRYAQINRCPTQCELEAGYEAARQAALWRFDTRQGKPLP